MAQLRRTVILALIAACPIFATERMEWQREDGTPLIGYFDAPEAKSFPIAILLQGSQVESVRRIHDSLKNGLTEIGMGVVTLEKQGIKGLDGVDEAEYNRCNSVTARLEDHLILLSKLKNNPGWNGKLALIGQGDGGKIASEIAVQKQDAVLALILIASGGAWPVKEELLASFRAEMSASGFSPGYIHSFLVQAKEEFENLKKTPVSKHQCFGFSYKYWDSLIKTDLPGNLIKISCPVYYVHGDKDDRIPKASVDSLVKGLKEMKKNVTVQRKDAGREIIRDPKIYEDAFVWLKDQISFAK